MKEFKMKLCIKNSNGTKLFSILTEILQTDTILANVYIQNIEHKQIYPILIKHQIIR
jgi:hypothetical protein